MPPVKGGIGHPIECWLAGAEADKAEKLTPSQAVKVKGKYDRADAFFVKIIDCQLAEVGPDPAVAVSVSELARTYEKYRGRWVVVEGTILSLRELPNYGSGQEVAVSLGDDKEGKTPVVQVICLQDPVLKVGATVKFKGRCGPDGIRARPTK
jgi:hypothetical protein